MSSGPISVGQLHYLGMTLFHSGILHYLSPAEFLLFFFLPLHGSHCTSLNSQFMVVEQLRLTDSAFCRGRRGGLQVLRGSNPSLIAHSFLSMKWKGFISGIHTLHIYIYMYIYFEILHMQLGHLVILNTGIIKLSYVTIINIVTCHPRRLFNNSTPESFSASDDKIELAYGSKWFRPIFGQRQNCEHLNVSL